MGTSPTEAPLQTTHHPDLEIYHRSFTVAGSQSWHSLPTSRVDVPAPHGLQGVQIPHVTKVAAPAAPDKYGDPASALLHIAPDKDAGRTCALMESATDKMASFSTGPIRQVEPPI